MVIRKDEHSPFELILSDGTQTGLLFEDFTKTLPSGYKGLFLFTLRPGAAFEPHGHQGESEAFYVLQGQMEFLDNGQSVCCQPGDLIITDEGDTHGGRNTGTGDAKLLGILIPHR